MVLITLTVLCSYHQCFQNCLITLNWDRVLNTDTLPLPHSQPWPHRLLPVSIDVTLLGPPVSGIRQCLFFCVWLVSLSIMSPRSIHVVAGVRISFPSKAELHSSVDGPHCVYPSPTSGHLGCFHLLAVVNCAAVNTDVQGFLPVCDFTSFVSVPRSGIARSYSDSMLNFFFFVTLLFFSFNWS